MRKMDIFISGLCLEIVSGNSNLPIEKCEKLLSNMGQEIIIGTLVKKGIYVTHLLLPTIKHCCLAAEAIKKKVPELNF